MSGPIVAVIQARATSTRLPGKVCLPLAGEPLLSRVIERVARTDRVDEICVAIPQGVAQNPVADVAALHPGVRLVRGPEDDVLARTILAAEATRASVVLRVTSDCPLYDPAIGASVLEMREQLGVSLASTALESGFPIGLDVEAVAADALLRAHRESRDPYDREHVTAWLWRGSGRGPVAFLDRTPDRRAWRLAVDTADDYRLVSALYDALYEQQPEFDFGAIECWLSAHPEWLGWNEHVPQTPYQW
ncbi:MAG: NTP transferase domain-containing protein [bacterium]|nr:NTP transferase domain-containing protein [bacterium]MCP5067750.1 NTP transferase domain-containing protein [bacterium]